MQKSDKDWFIKFNPTAYIERVLHLIAVRKAFKDEKSVCMKFA